MIGAVGFLAVMVVMSLGYRLGPYVFDGFLSRRYEELFCSADVWEIDRRFEQVLIEHSLDS